jgi:hypothetical protein
VYADWLEERDDPGACALRIWVEPVRSQYEEASYRSLVNLMERFWTALSAADPDWVELVGEARDWVGARLAELAARLHLRARYGRKLDRQWIDAVLRSSFQPAWSVYFWTNSPARRKANLWRERRCLTVDRVTGAIVTPV